MYDFRSLHCSIDNKINRPSKNAEKIPSLEENCGSNFNISCRMPHNNIEIHYYCKNLEGHLKVAYTFFKWNKL